MCQRVHPSPSDASNCQASLSPSISCQPQTIFALQGSAPHADNIPSENLPSRLQILYQPGHSAGVMMDITIPWATLNPHCLWLNHLGLEPYTIPGFTILTQPHPATTTEAFSSSSSSSSSISVNDARRPLSSVL